jgi:tetratricopeptide (TPR) repeat protein
MLKNLGRAVVLSGLLMATGCGTLPPGESVPVETEPQYTEVEQLKPPSVTPSQPEPQPKPALTDAAQNLIKKAAEVAAEGNYEQAIALLERALRIGPHRPEVYLSMAKTYKAKGDYAMASATAERGMLYCSGAMQCEALRLYTR